MSFMSYFPVFFPPVFSQFLTHEFNWKIPEFSESYVSHSEFFDNSALRYFQLFPVFQLFEYSRTQAELRQNSGPCLSWSEFI